jgi:hypothetical protein
VLNEPHYTGKVSHQKDGKIGGKKVEKLVNYIRPSGSISVLIIQLSHGLKMIKVIKSGGIN